MSDKTSDENVANIEIVIKDCREHLKLYGEAFITTDELDRLENLLSEREQMKQCYEERDNELWERVKQCNNLQTEIDRIYADKEELIEINKKQNKQIQELEEERKGVLDLIFEYGQIDGGHHKMWVIDQIVRILTKNKYNEWIKNYVYDEETGDIYSWDKGIAP